MLEKNMSLHYKEKFRVGFQNLKYGMGTPTENP
jgi:hypothetical protein